MKTTPSPTVVTEAAQPLPQASAPVWQVYIVANAAGALYTGITTDLGRRLTEHREGRRGARFFRFCAPARILFSERHESRASASRREAQIKRLSRHAKLALIASFASFAP